MNSMIQSKHCFVASCGHDVAQGGRFSILGRHETWCEACVIRCQRCLDEFENAQNEYLDKIARA